MSELSAMAAATVSAAGQSLATGCGVGNNNDGVVRIAAAPTSTSHVTPPRPSTAPAALGGTTNAIMMTQEAKETIGAVITVEKSKQNNSSTQPMTMTSDNVDNNVLNNDSTSASSTSNATCGKSKANAKTNEQQLNDPITAYISCPDGSTVDLTTARGDDDTTTSSSYVILGRGKLGIPAEAIHVSRKAAVLRLVHGMDEGTHALELVVLGSQPCRVTRQNGHGGNGCSDDADGGVDTADSAATGSSCTTTFVRSIAQLLASDGKSPDNILTPSTVHIRDGDVIEPYDRPADCTYEEAKAKGVYYPFAVRFANSGANPATQSDETKIDGTAFVEASQRIAREGAEEEEEAVEHSQGTVGMETAVAFTGADTAAAAADRIETKSMGMGDEPTKEEATSEDSKMIPEQTGPVTAPELTVAEPKVQENAEGAKLDSVDDTTTANAPVQVAEGDNKRIDEMQIDKDKVEDNRNVKVDKIPSSSEESSDEEEYGYSGAQDARDDIIEILQELEAPGSFAVAGSCNGKLLMPGLTVEGIGNIGLPLSENQAKDLAKRCEQAPFGRGSETIVDKNVRNTFQLSPDHFKISNPGWNEEIKDLTGKVCQGLGVQNQLKVEAQLYKLLLYEEGSFFAPHRDSEKTNGMFGTLVIVLPSQFTGGELVVKHKGDTETFNQSPSSSFSSQYASFYADCKHELKKVTSGYRLCLVYNLVKVGAGAQPRAADNSTVIKRVKAAASAWGSDFDSRSEKVILMTEHLYTPAGIKNGTGSSKYKGADARVVELLEMAIEKGADIDFDHGTVSLSETGYAEEDGYGYGYGRYGGYDGGFSWAETTDRDLSLSLSTWGRVDISEEEEMVPEDYFENQDPEETFEPTGNEGVNAERQYADGEAIVIWPRSQRWRIVTNNDTSRMCDYLLKACEEGTSDSEPRDDCIEKTKIVIPRVTSTGSSSYSYGSNSQTNVTKMIKILVSIGDDKLASTFLTSYLSSNSKTTPDAILDQIGLLTVGFGSECIRPSLLESLKPDRYSNDPTASANFLIKCCTSLRSKESNNSLVNDLIAGFVDSASPSKVEDRRKPLKRMDSFPLKGVLGLFIGETAVPNAGALVKRLLEGIVWATSQTIEEPSRYTWSYSRPTTVSPKGPTILLGASLRLGSVCEKFGWAEFEDFLVSAGKKMCECGSAADALALIDDIAPADSSQESDRSRICARMASIACTSMLSAHSQSTPPSQASALLTTYKKLVTIIGRYCPSCATEFVASAKNLDIDTILFPLITGSAFRASATEVMKESLGVLTYFCAQALAPRVANELGSITVWSLPNANLSRNASYSSFLRSPCRKVHDWQVRKSDHAGFIGDLRPLIRLGEVRAESYQPHGRGGSYHFKITKLKSRSVPVSSLNTLSCTCSSGTSSSRYSSGYRYGQSSATSSACLLKQHKAILSKYREDQRKLSVIEKLLTPEQQSQIATIKNRKRPAPTAAAAGGGALERVDLTSSPTTARRSGAQQASKKQKTSSVEVIDLT